MLLRLGEQFVPAPHPAHPRPPLFAGVARHQLVQRSLHRQFLFPQRPRQLLDGRRLIRRINNRFQCRSSLFASHAVFSSLRILSALSVSALFLPSLDLQLSTVNYLYSSSICLIPPASSNAKSNILCFRTRISPNCFSCTSATACTFTISKTAKNATIIACREGHASKNRIKFTVLSALARICARKAAIICATVNSSCRNSIRETSFFRSSTCWNTFTKSTSETTSSPSVPSSL